MRTHPGLHRRLPAVGVYVQVSIGAHPFTTFLNVLNLIHLVTDFLWGARIVTNTVFGLRSTTCTVPPFTCSQHSPGRGQAAVIENPPRKTHGQNHGQ